MRNTDSIGLLDLLQKTTGCPYISDLHDARYAKGVKKAVLSIDPGAYSDKVWSDAVIYITGIDTSYALAEDAIAALIAYLDQAKT